MTYTEVAKRLTDQFKLYSRGTSLFPTHLFVGQALFDVYLTGADKLARWSSEEPAYKAAPLFKTTTMEAVKSLKPWEIVFGRKVTIEQSTE